MDKVYSDDCIKIYSSIKDYFKDNGILVLNNENYKSLDDFVNLIYLNIN